MAVNPIRTWAKDPNSILDYMVDWTEWLGLDTIATVTWTIPAGISNTGTINSTHTATVWLSGGTTNTNYTVTVKITTVAGRTDQRSFQINVVAR